MKTAPRNCLIWFKSAICRESSCAKKKFIVAFCSLQQTIECCKVNNGCDKSCASCTTLHLRGMNGLRWVILACGMSSQTSWITRHNCSMVSGGGSCDLIWQSVRSLANVRFDGVQDIEYTGQGSVWTAFDLWKSCVRQIEKGQAWHRNPVEPCRTQLPIQDGASIWSSGTQCKSHEIFMHDLCGYSGVMTS